MNCCNHDCNEGKNCPMRTTAQSIDSIQKIESAAGVVLAIVIGAVLAVALFYGLSK